MSKFLSKINPIVVVIALIAIATGTLVFAKTQTAYASCSGQVDFPNTAVIYCGLTGSSANDYAHSLKNYYDNNNDGRAGHLHYDVRNFFNGQGLTGSVMADGNWVLGHTDLKTKQIVLDNGTVVGTATAVFARCTSNGDPHCAISQSGTIMSTPDFYGGKFGNSMRTIIHMKADGTADFAVWTPCGNEVRFVPTPPKPKTLTCVQLDMDNSDAFNFTFSVTANRENLAVDNFYFDFGDGQNKEVATNDQGKDGQIKGSIGHLYGASAREQTLTIKVYVNKLGQHGTQGVTGENCVKTIPPKEKLTFACLDLKATLLKSTSTSRTYRFRATVQGTDTVKNFQFVFGDKHQTAFQTSNIVKSHIYTFSSSKANLFKAYFVANSNGGAKTDKKNANCQFKFSTTTKLVRTGPGDNLGLVAVASTLGVGLYQFVLRRRLA